MSYQITVVVKDGKAEIDPTGVTTDASVDGKYVINGHVPIDGTWQDENIQVTRTVDGKSVIQASGTHYK